MIRVRRPAIDVDRWGRSGGRGPRRSTEELPAEPPGEREESEPREHGREIRSEMDQLHPSFGAPEEIVLDLVAHIEHHEERDEESERDGDETIQTVHFSFFCFPQPRLHRVVVSSQESFMSSVRNLPGLLPIIEVS